MRRRLAILGLVIGALLPACGTLLAASDDDESKTPEQIRGDGGNNDGTTGTADGSSTSDTGSSSDAANDILPSSDATPDAPLSASDLYRAAVMADVPLAYWRFGEALGATTFASETNQYPAVAGPGTKAPSITAPGIFGNTSHALLFDGQLGMNASVANFPFLSNTFTFEAWVRIKSVLDGKFRHLFQHSDGSVSYGIYLYGPEGIVIERIQNGTKQQRSALSFSLNKWHHVVATRDTSLHLYVDGAEQSTSGSFGTNAGSTGDFMLGAKSASEDSLPDDTSITEVAVYDKALSAMRVTAHFTAGDAGL